MGGFRDYLEVFDRRSSDVTIGRPYEASNYYERDFKVGDQQYTFYAEVRPEEFESPTGATTRLDVWSVEFSAVRGNSRYGITKTGRPLDVFQVVMEIIEDFLSSYRQHIEVVSFMASEISRKILYLKMIQRFAEPMGFAMIKSPTSDKKQDADFILVRKDLQSKIKPPEQQMSLSGLKGFKSLQAPYI